MGNERYKIINSIDRDTYCVGCPVQIEKVNILLDTSSNSLFMRLKLNNAAQKTVSAVYLSADYYNALNQPVQSDVSVSFSGLNCPTGQSCFTDMLAALPNNDVFYARLSIKRIVFSDASSIETSGVTVKLSKQKRIKKELVAAAQSLLNDQIEFVPVKAEHDVWICGCGQINENNVCIKCGAEKDDAFRCITSKSLNEEADRLKKVRAENELKEKQERLKKRKKIIISVCVIAAIAVICIICTPFVADYMEERQLEERYNQMIEDYANGNLEDDYSDLKGYKDRDEIRTEARYNQMVSAYSNGNFEGEYDDLKDYKDGAKYYYYKKAHESWDFDNDIGAYGSTIKNLKNASGILDADEKLKLISDKVSQYNGTWCTTKYNTLNYYIFIKDGMVAMELDNDDDGEYYYEELVKVVFGDEDIKKYFGDSNLASSDTTLKTNIIGLVDSHGELYSQGYIFMDVDGGQMFAADISEQSYGTFNGLYTKISDSAPPSK